MSSKFEFFRTFYDYDVLFCIDFDERTCKQKHEQNIKNDDKNDRDERHLTVQRTTPNHKMNMKWENNHPKIPNVNILRQFSCHMQ